MEEEYSGDTKIKVLTGKFMVLNLWYYMHVLGKNKVIKSKAYLTF